MLLNKRKETRVKFNPGLSTNRPSNNSAWMLKEHINFRYLWKFDLDISNGFGEILFKKLEILQRMYGSLNFYT